MNRVGARVAVSVATSLLVASFAVGAPVARAQTLVGDYQFQDTLGAGSGTPNFEPIGTTAFATETVDGVSRRVLVWDQGNGIRLYPTSQLNPASHYTIVMLLRVQQVDGYRRLIDFKQGGFNDQYGLYASAGSLLFYKFNTVYGGASITPNTWVQVVLTRDASANVVGYVNGVQQFSFMDTDADAIAPNDALHLFKDEDGLQEETAGAIARFRLYNDALNAEQVAGLDRLPGAFPSGSPTPTPTASSNPSPSPSASPTPSSSPTAQPTPTPTPTSSPPVGGTVVIVHDPEDVDGPLDIEKVVVRELDARYTVKLELYGDIPQSALSSQGKPGSASLYLDTAPGQGQAEAEYRVKVFHNGTEWRSQILRLSDGEVTGSGPAEKISPRTLRFMFEKNEITLEQDPIGFLAKTTFKKRNGACEVACRDNAPNRGFASSAD
jgi:hypothetical protein